MRIYCIADIHFGKRKDSESLYKELKEYFLKEIEENGADLVALCGDLTDCKLQLNSEAVMYYNRFMDELHRLAEAQDFDIVAVNGTFSHERNQIKSFSHYFDKKLRYFDKPSAFFYRGKSFLILPEEYMRNEQEQKELDKLLENKYDFAFGHGMFDHAGMAAIQSESTKTRMSWNYKTFANNIKHYVVFGHIHIGTKYKNIIYCGSFSRDRFGEEEDKGFYFFEIDDNGTLLREKKIINTGAPKYTYVYISFLSSELEPMLKELREYYEKNDYIRIIVDKSIPEDVYNNILGFVKNHERSSVVSKLPKKLAIKDESEEEIISEYIEKLKKYKGMDFLEITKTVAKDLYNEDFTTEEINKYLNEE